MEGLVSCFSKLRCPDASALKDEMQRVERLSTAKTNAGHLEDEQGQASSDLQPWKLGLDNILTIMFKMPTSMRLDYLHESTMTNTLAWNLALLEQPQHDNPRLTLPGD